MTDNLTKMNSQLPSFEGATSLELFSVVNKYTDEVSKMKVYVDAIYQLQLSDQPAINSIVDATNTLVDQFNTIAGSAADLQLQQVQEENQQLEQQQPQQQQSQIDQQLQAQKHKQDCANLRTFLFARYGAFGSSETMDRYHQAGCP